MSNKIELSDVISLWIKEKSISNCFSIINSNGYDCIFLRCGLVIGHDDTTLLIGIIKDGLIYCFYDLDMTHTVVSPSEPNMFDKLLTEFNNIHVKYGCKDVK